MKRCIFWLGAVSVLMAVLMSPATSVAAASQPAATTACAEQAGTNACVDADKDGVPDSQDQCPFTASGANVGANGCQKVAMGELRKTFYVHFALGKADVQDTFLAEIEAVAKLASDYPQALFTLTGYADSTGPATLNLRLSRARAQAVKQLLVGKFGVSASRISTDGKGELDPVASNDTDAGRAENRRVEMLVTAKVMTIS